MTVTFPHPTAETVLPCVTAEWQSTQSVWNLWLGDATEGVLSREGRDKLRAEVYDVLEVLWERRRVEKHRVSESHVQWRRRLRADPHRHNDDPSDASGPVDSNGFDYPPPASEYQ